jgi:hypothetical protein
MLIQARIESKHPLKTSLTAARTIAEKGKNLHLYGRHSQRWKLCPGGSLNVLVPRSGQAPLKSMTGH